MRIAGERGGHQSVFSGSELDSACSLSNAVLYTKPKPPCTIEAIARV